MNTPTAIVISSLALGFGGVAAYFAFSPSGADDVARAASPPEDAGRIAQSATAAEVDTLRSTIQDLQEQISVLRTAPRRSATGPGVSEEALAAAVAAYFENQGLDTAASSEDGASGAPREFETAEDAFALLATLDPTEAMNLWEQIVDQGLDDEVLALYRAAAEAAPNDPEAQFALGQALIGRTQQATGPMAGVYATQADEAFDRALELDPTHWEARFTKAMSLSFWPPNLGKQPAAIREFETLIEQQAGMPAEPAFAQTHFTLGNLYQQNGQPEKAMEIWQAGLALYPNNQELANQIALAGGR